MKRVRVSRDAERDLDEIWVFIARDSAEAANRKLRNWWTGFWLLRSSPAGLGMSSSLAFAATR
jgi:plasmid stabilization system protein ParE